MEALGIEPKLLIAQIVNFVIVLFLLRKFAYNPILNMLDNRSKQIEKGLADSKEATEKLAKAEEEAEIIREKAFRDASEILANAKKEAEAKGTTILAKANDQAASLKKNATDEALSIKSRALREAKGDLSDLVIAALTQIGEDLPEKEKERLTAKALKEL